MFKENEKKKNLLFVMSKTSIADFNERKFGCLSNASYLIVFMKLFGFN